MGIFDDEDRKMALASAQPQGNELNQLARDISHDLLGYIGGHPCGEDVSVGVSENLITVRGKTSGRLLEITCEGSDTFHLRDRIEGGFPRQVAVMPPKPISTNGNAVSRSEMAHRAVKWLQDRRAA